MNSLDFAKHILNKNVYYMIKYIICLIIFYKLTVI